MVLVVCVFLLTCILLSVFWHDYPDSFVFSDSCFFSLLCLKVLILPVPLVLFMLVVCVHTRHDVLQPPSFTPFLFPHLHSLPSSFISTPICCQTRFVSTSVCHRQSLFDLGRSIRWRTHSSIPIRLLLVRRCLSIARKIDPPKTRTMEWCW